MSLRIPAGSFRIEGTSVSWQTSEGVVTAYVQLPGEVIRTKVTPSELCDLAILANAALASIPHAAPSEDTTP